MRNDNKRSFGKQYAIDTGAGTVSGLVVAGATHPLDTLTVRDQTSPGKRRVAEAWGKFRQAIGLPKKAPKINPKNLYKGLGWRMLKTTSAGAIGYPVFTGSKRLIEDLVDPQEKTAALLRAHGIKKQGSLSLLVRGASQGRNFFKGAVGFGKPA